MSSLIGKIPLWWDFPVATASWARPLLLLYAVFLYLCLFAAYSDCFMSRPVDDPTACLHTSNFYWDSLTTMRPSSDSDDSATRTIS